MPGRRNKYKADFKANVALEALKGDKSTAELAQIYQVHPAMITNWKKQLTENASTAFEARGPGDKDADVDVDALYRKIGQLEVERCTDGAQFSVLVEWVNIIRPLRGAGRTEYVRRKHLQSLNYICPSEPNIGPCLCSAPDVDRIEL